MAHVARGAEELDEDVARQLAAYAVSGVLVGDLGAQLRVEYAHLVGEQDEMQQHIGVQDDEDQRAEPEEAGQGQIDIQEGQLDAVLEEQILVGHRGGGDEQVEQDEQIADPQGAADRGGVHHGRLQRFQVAGLAGQGFGGFG